MSIVIDINILNQIVRIRYMLLNIVKDEEVGDTEIVNEISKVMVDRDVIERLLFGGFQKLHFFQTFVLIS